MTGVTVGGIVGVGVTVRVGTAVPVPVLVMVGVGAGVRVGVAAVTGQLALFGGITVTVALFVQARRDWPGGKGIGVGDWL